MSRTEPKFLVSENTVMWAFRYALPRRSGVYVDVTDTLKRLWEDLEIATQNQIQGEIRHAISIGAAGDFIDERGWKEFLEWTETVKAEKR
jgi:hypothetical protein